MPAFNFKLTRIESNNSYFRSKDVVGWGNELPEVGKPFMMFGPPLEDLDADFRMITTSPVKVIEGSPETGINFETLNSRYTLEVL